MWISAVAAYALVVLGACAERSPRLVAPFGDEAVARHPITQEFSALGRVVVGRYHTGVDLFAPCGTPVRSIAGGELLVADRGDGDGAHVVVRHADGLHARYDHLATLARGPGPVAAGDLLARSGSDAGRGGCHLHLALRVGRPPEGGYSAVPPSELGYVDPARVLGARLAPPR